MQHNIRLLLFTLVILVLIIITNSTVYALTIVDDKVYTQYGEVISLDDYYLFRQFYHLTDEFLDSESLYRQLDEKIEIAKNILYSGDYLYKISWTSEDSYFGSYISTEEGLDMLENDIEEENEYYICTTDILLARLTVDFDIPEGDEDIYTHEPIDYMEYCDKEMVISKMSNTQEKITIEDENESLIGKNLSKIVCSFIGIIFVSLTFLFIKKKIKKSTYSR